MRASGPDGVLLIERVADPIGAGRGDERVGKRWRDALLHEDALGTDAALPGVGKTRCHGRLHRRIEIGIGKDDEGIGAAELEHRLLAGAPGDRRDRPPGADTAGDGDAADARVGDDPGRRGVIDPPE